MSQWIAYLLPDPAAPGSIPSVPDVAEGNQQRCSEESEQWLENVERNHLVLASGELLATSTKKINLKVPPIPIKR